MFRTTFARLAVSFCALLAAGVARAQEPPYFVTYSHLMEEPGSLEVEAKAALGHPKDGGSFQGSSLELEYGSAAWWTTELYLDGQHTAGDSTLFTGFRLENRIRPIFRELPVNPVLYVEYEDINGANKSLLEVVGHDGQSDLATPNAEARAERLREVETKLILSGNARGWNVAANIIGEKNLAHAPWEFGYTLAASRPLRLLASAVNSRFSTEQLTAGAELYGGLGDTASLGLHDTSHYLAADLGWSPTASWTVKVSPGFGLNDNSLHHLVRFGVSYEFGQVSSLWPSRRPR